MRYVQSKELDGQFVRRANRGYQNSGDLLLHPLCPPLQKVERGKPEGEISGEGKVGLEVPLWLKPEDHKIKEIAFGFQARRSDSKRRFLNMRKSKHRRQTWR